MNAGRLPKGEKADSTSPLDIARYIADLTLGLSAMARQSDLGVLAYLLDIARLEAEEIALHSNARRD